MYLIENNTKESDNIYTIDIEIKNIPTFVLYSAVNINDVKINNHFIFVNIYNKSSMLNINGTQSTSIQTSRYLSRNVEAKNNKPIYYDFVSRSQIPIVF